MIYCIWWTNSMIISWCLLMTMLPDVGVNIQLFGIQNVPKLSAPSRFAKLAFPLNKRRFVYSCKNLLFIYLYYQEYISRIVRVYIRIYAWEFDVWWYLLTAALWCNFLRTEVLGQASEALPPKAFVFLSILDVVFPNKPVCLEITIDY